jgi:hypothetical protein
LIFFKTIQKIPKLSWPLDLIISYLIHLNTLDENPKPSQPLTKSALESNFATSLGVPTIMCSYHTEANICPSGSTDQILDRANHSRRINFEVIQRSKSFRCTKLPLSPLADDSLSLIRSPNFGHIKTSDHHKKVPHLYASKPMHFASPSTSHLASKRSRRLRPPEASSYRSSLINHQRPTKKPSS